MPPICPHPENPHIFLFRGKPTLLVTSAEHYGAVINLDFDFIPYLDALAAYGMNYTRIYMGAYIEPEEYFIHDNTLGPKIGRYCLPWGRSDQPGYAYGGNLFDLDQWNGEYFERLHAFVRAADQRGVVVEICMFNCMYPDTWAQMPLFHVNNIQGVGRCECKDFQTLKHPDLVARQDAYVRKITRELNAYDNIILEICDEPGIHGTTPEEYTPWLRHLLGVAHEAEVDLPNQHMVGQQICGVLGGEVDVTGDPDVELIISQYITQTSGAQFGGMELLESEYSHNKPIELNETAYYPIWYKGDILAASRVEAWEFMVGGGAGFNQLNGLYTYLNPAAAGTENDLILGQLKLLMDFLYSFDLLRLRRDPNLIVGPLPPGAFARAMSQPGREYALYIHHSEDTHVYYIVQPGEYQETLTLAIAPGSYHLEWIEPASGVILAAENFEHVNGPRAFTTPIYSIDLALRLRARS